MAVLKQLAPHLAVIHAQNEAVLAFDAASRLALLDTLRRQSTTRRSPRPSTAGTQVRHRIADLERDEHDRLRLLDLWSFQRKEIADAQLAAGRRREARSREARAGQRRARSTALRWRPTTRCMRAMPRPRRSIRAATRQIEELLALRRAVSRRCA